MNRYERWKNAGVIVVFGVMTVGYGFFVSAKPVASQQPRWVAPGTATALPTPSPNAPFTLPSTSAATTQPPTVPSVTPGAATETLRPIAGAANPAAMGAAAPKAMNPVVTATPNTAGAALADMTAQAQAVAQKFQLTPEQEVYLDKVLTAWERHSSQIQTLRMQNHPVGV
jgi:hypothetical protein